MSHNKPVTHTTSVLPVQRVKHHLLGSRGFSMVELIVACAILTVISVLALPAYNKIKDRARGVRAMEEIRGLEKTINAWSIDRGGNLPSFNDLTQAGAIQNDPWGHRYEYHPKSNSIPIEPTYNARYEHNLGPVMGMLNTDYDLYSLGADGASADDSGDMSDSRCLDDIIRSGDGGWVGEGTNLNL